LPDAAADRFDHLITREDKDILESTDPDAPVDTRRRDVEYSMGSDRQGSADPQAVDGTARADGEAEVRR
jgi:hypothetical protein